MTALSMVAGHNCADFSRPSSGNFGLGGFIFSREILARFFRTLFFSGFDKWIEVPSHHPDGPGTVRVWMLFTFVAARRTWPWRTGAAGPGEEARIAGAAGYA
jgi:hypothetical protein